MNNVLYIFGGLLIILVALATLTALPDIMRYLRIRSM